MATWEEVKRGIDTKQTGRRGRNNTRGRRPLSQVAAGQARSPFEGRAQKGAGGLGGLLGLFKEHYNEVAGTLSRGKAGDRARGLSDMVAGNVRQGLPMRKNSANLLAPGLLGSLVLNNREE